MDKVAIMITVELTSEELRILREIDKYCRNGRDINRSMPVRTLFDEYKCSGPTISGLISNDLIYSRSPEYPYYQSGAGDELYKFKVCVTSTGIEVVKAAKKVRKQKVGTR